MIEPARHVPLRPIPWEETAVSQAIDEIVSDALGHFGGDQFWPAHPLDEGEEDGHSSVYFGAAGVIWALEHLRRVGATKAHFDFRPHLSQLLEKTKAEMPAYGNYARHGSLLFGDMGTALLIMRLQPTSAIADLVYARAVANNELPLRELMWGTAGRTASRRPRGDSRRPAVGAGSLWQSWQIPGPRARICRQHDPADARMGLAHRKPARPHR
jgi:hypothetical protein